MKIQMFTIRTPLQASLANPVEDRPESSALPTPTKIPLTPLPPLGPDNYIKQSSVLEVLSRWE